MLFKKDSTTLSLPKICPHPPQLWKLPDGFDNKQLEPVPEIRTIPPALVAVTKGPRVSLHVWHSTVMFECLAIRCDEIVSWFSWLSAPLRDNPRLTNGVSGEMPSESFALVTKSAIRLQHSSSPKTTQHNTTSCSYWQVKTHNESSKVQDNLEVKDQVKDHLDWAYNSYGLGSSA